MDGERADRRIAWWGLDGRAKPMREAGLIVATFGSPEGLALSGLPGSYGAGGGGGRVVPRQLPPTVRLFAGRAGELAALSGLLTGAATSGGGGAVVISAIGGTAGVGRTALAVYWAHRVADRFPDGQLSVNLRGFSPAGR